MIGNKLELTWVGKNEKLKIEPRILIEDNTKSYGDINSENMIIHGDNLLTLKSLESKFTEKIKCIYIDPPYNTGAAFEQYDDNLEHSIWLNLMNERIKILHKLLRDDGVIFIQIDNNEFAYLKIICDEIFGRNNFVSNITCKVKAPSGVASGSQMIFDCSEYILVYAKDKAKMTYKHLSEDAEIVDDNSKTAKFYKYLLEEINYDNMVLEKKFESEKLYKISNQDYKIKTMTEFSAKSYFDNYEKIFRTASLSGGREKIIKEYLDTIEYGDGLFVFEHVPTKGKNSGKLCRDLIFKRGSILKLCDFARRDEKINAVVKEQHITSMFNNDWWQGIAAEGGITLKNGKKPEILLKTILEMVTEEGDWVLDSFLGSGTTCAVAHKMKRKYIGIELGEQCYSHCKVRLDNVINGDKSGISSAVNWKGGGGYKFYELAPTLLKKDIFEQEIINSKYDEKMLSEAVALHEGFDYNPSIECYWKQSKGTENSYLYVTTNFVGEATLDNIKNEMKENEYLIIACKFYDENIEYKYKNIKIKKIPEMLLNRCEYGVDSYALNIEEQVEEECEDE